MARRIINRQPVQYVLEGYAAPGDLYITFPDAKNINRVPNEFQVRPGRGVWLATLTADNPDQAMRLSLQHGGSVTGTGSVSICGKIDNPVLWLLARPQGTLGREVRYVLTLTKTAPPPLRNCSLTGLVKAVLAWH